MPSAALWRFQLQIPDASRPPDLARLRDLVARCRRHNGIGPEAQGYGQQVIADGHA